MNLFAAVQKMTGRRLPKWLSGEDGLVVLPFHNTGLVNVGGLDGNVKFADICTTIPGKFDLYLSGMSYADLMSYLAHMDQKKKEVEVSKKPATVKRVNQVGVTNINQ